MRCRAAFWLLALFAVAMFAAAPAFAAEKPIGGVVKVKPDAYGKVPAGARKVLQTSDPVVTDQTVETTATGYLHLRFIDRSDLWLDADSSLVLDKLVFNRATTAGEYVVELNLGLFRIITGALPHASYQVLTPTAVIGVRGTDFTVAVAKNGWTRISVYSGIVTVRPRQGGKPVEVATPFTASITRPNGPVLVSRQQRIAPPADSIIEWPLPTSSADDIDDSGRNIGAASSGSSGTGSSSGSSGSSGSTGGSAGSGSP